MRWWRMGRVCFRFPNCNSVLRFALSTYLDQKIGEHLENPTLGFFALWFRRRSRCCYRTSSGRFFRRQCYSTVRQEDEDEGWIGSKAVWCRWINDLGVEDM